MLKDGGRQPKKNRYFVLDFSENKQNPTVLGAGARIGEVGISTISLFWHLVGAT